MALAGLEAGAMMGVLSEGDPTRPHSCPALMIEDWDFDSMRSEAELLIILAVFVTSSAMLSFRVFIISLKSW